MSEASGARSSRKWIGRSAMGLYVLFLLVMLAFTYDACSDFWKIDACLEAGRRWNPDTNICEPR